MNIDGLYLGDCSILWTAKARFPNFLLVRRTVKSSRVADLSPLGFEAEHCTIMDIIHEGKVPEWILHMRREIFKAILAQMGSQCSC